MTSQESGNMGKNPSFTALNQFDIGAAFGQFMIA
jgi:hypothetical protein